MKVPQTILMAISLYYFQREKQYKNLPITDTTSRLRVINDKYRWDKDKILDQIFEECQRLGFTCSSSCGNFFISQGNDNCEISQSNIDEFLILHVYHILQNI